MLTTKRALIIGYGRAGKRHRKILQDLHIIHGIVEPDNSQFHNYFEDSIHDQNLAYIENYVPTYEHLSYALSEQVWNVAVICTPPSLHLDQIEQCLDADMWVLCEKPLCALGEEQLIRARNLLDHDNAHKLMFAYNYRYNPDMIKFDEALVYPLWGVIARQQRSDLPDWGLLLDHVSHDVDTLRWTSGMSFFISDDVSYVDDTENGTKTWTINGEMEDGNSVLIKEEVTDFKSPRTAIVVSPHGFMMMSPNKEMYTAMWYDFIRFTNREKSLGATIRSDLKDALKTQQILETINNVWLSNQDGDS